VDPVEKKPLNNFLPGTWCLSLSCTGCNLSCRWCQNSDISQVAPEDSDRTALTAEDLGKFKKAIGRFPSADTADFPFGGVLKVDGRVVFYRYHVAKKIDFCGRDALYCVLGAVPFVDAAKIDPAMLFALPEFAGPMKPFPVALEVPEADSASVPDWLKNLDAMTLDVRITGPADNPSYAVEQNTIELQQTPAEDAAFDGRARSPSAPLDSVGPFGWLGEPALPFTFTSVFSAHDGIRSLSVKSSGFAVRFTMRTSPSFG
jgi:hypothetical protein